VTADVLQQGHGYVKKVRQPLPVTLFSHLRQSSATTLRQTAGTWCVRAGVMPYEPWQDSFAFLAVGLLVFALIVGFLIAYMS
jgi:hypothetical protein